jgi:hypothetical protein
VTSPRPGQDPFHDQEPENHSRPRGRGDRDRNALRPGDRRSGPAGPRQRADAGGASPAHRAAGPGTNEDTLDQVRYQDYYLDIRTAPAAARAWLDVPRPTYDIGTLFPVDPSDIALARSYDLLIHLHDVREAQM